MIEHWRSYKDFAIEHGGYLADAVERALKSNTLIMDADDWLELNTRVYEFRKRAKRATDGTDPHEAPTAATDES